MTDIRGIVAYPITPFDRETGAFDPKPLHSLLDSMITSGVDAIAPLGSTGESAYLSDTEWEAVARETVAYVDRRVPTVVGVSDLTTGGALKRARIAAEAGADAVMILPTSYWHLDEREIREHVTTVADSIGIPTMIYNNPATTGIDMTPEFLVELVSAVEGITMIKESTGDITRMNRIRELGGGEIPFFNGSNPLAAKAFEAGASGWCTAAPCLAAEQVVEFWRRLRLGESDSAAMLFQQIEPLLNAIVSRGLPSTVKDGLQLLGIDAGVPRRPLLPLDDATRATLSDALELARP
ncbi:dihydrodipicolinate synthase family protein [Rhodococcoides kyotonense]|uniref:4-hydroxy-tetrahydrodipicolinate synthase n=1 Tax=Rhodococcoides kyotonense TaxID=398843 RepID=A0A239IKL7_9NOCA|nr:dihydrodipicolinate synthase family protein [Rhodococcus kyotonensis]SNS93952.1 4-hydroxy-tetrahydrodipicolinate synthase [Rhodococcus kyotonensis]